MLAGLLTVVLLSLGTDVVLHRLNIFSPLGQRAAERLFVWATIYRTLYGILGSYLTARLAPNRPMWHAMVGAVIGMILGSLGAARGTKTLGPLVSSRPDRYGDSLRLHRRQTPGSADSWLTCLAVM